MKQYTSLVLIALLQFQHVVAQRGSRQGSTRRLKGNKDDSEDLLLPGDCDICSEGRPSSLTLQYLTSGQESLFQGSRATCGAQMYPSTTITLNDQNFEVVNGTVFTVLGSFDASTEVTFDGMSNLDCEFHTSCSVPLVAGDQIGPFLVLDGDGRCLPDPSGLCEICSKENKNRPLSLTIRYNSTGVNSNFQDSIRATCVEGMYPSLATFEVQNKNGFAQQFMQISTGDEFTIVGEFDAETNFIFSTGDECFIHTSCSQPLVAGDQIGPFLILEGNECSFTPPTATPSMFPSSSPSLLPTSIPSFSPTALPSYVPSLAPSAGPTSIPSSSPSGEPTSTPSSLPSTEPTTSPSFSPTSSPSGSPSDIPSTTPSVSPSAPCIAVDAAEYRCGNPITARFNFFDPLPDDWIGIYPCTDNVYLHSILWQYTCGEAPCQSEGLLSGEVVFERLLDINVAGPHTWPIAPFTTKDGTVNRCFKAVLLRNDGPSVPPYIQICESTEFIINENFNPGCGIIP